VHNREDNLLPQVEPFLQAHSDIKCYILCVRNPTGGKKKKVLIIRVLYFLQFELETGHYLCCKAASMPVTLLYSICPPWHSKAA
jgi:hypothetical protein